MTKKRTCYGHPAHHTTERITQHYLQSCVRADVWEVIEQLRRDHNLTISGAAHHLMRLGAGLQPLPPLRND